MPKVVIQDGVLCFDAGSVKLDCSCGPGQACCDNGQFIPWTRTGTGTGAISPSLDGQLLVFQSGASTIQDEINFLGAPSATTVQAYDKIGDCVARIRVQYRYNLQATRDLNFGSTITTGNTLVQVEYRPLPLIASTSGGAITYEVLRMSITATSAPGIEARLVWGFHTNLATCADPFSGCVACETLQLLGASAFPLGLGSVPEDSPGVFTGTGAGGAAPLEFFGTPQFLQGSSSLSAGDVSTSWSLNASALSIQPLADGGGPVNGYYCPVVNQLRVENGCGAITDPSLPLSQASTQQDCVGCGSGGLT